MWGYVTNCGTEGNLHGILTARENLPDGELAADMNGAFCRLKYLMQTHMRLLQSCNSSAIITERPQL